MFYLGMPLVTYLWPISIMAIPTPTHIGAFNPIPLTTPDCFTNTKPYCTK